jgi:hypothetical protein
MTKFYPVVSHIYPTNESVLQRAYDRYIADGNPPSLKGVNCMYRVGTQTHAFNACAIGLSIPDEMETWVGS